MATSAFAQEVPAPEEAEAIKHEKYDENKLGAHIGAIQPIVIFSGSSTSVMGSDFYTIGFPMGITVKPCDKLFFDMEFVPFFTPGDSVTAHKVDLLVHPGVLFPLGGGFTFGLRGAFEIGNGQVGFTPLLNKAFPLKGGGAFFTELVLPMRFGPMPNSDFVNIIGLHVGYGF
ncbi:MAG: hypothetical protein COA57_09440 [Flavobacteriales bacterium]|nr:MAG: hypothetical protein COA57_09440 [Flavobacteriales bacterium]